MTMTLQEISDRLEIQELFVDYTQAIDRRNWDALDDVFTADAFIDYAETGGSKGDLPSTKEFLAQAMPMFKTFQHMVGTSKIVVDGDTATATSICHNPMVLPGENGGAPRTFYVGLWYHDKLVRTADGWRIKERVEELSYFHNAPEAMVPPGF
jgi:hypothetical protein